MSVTRTMTSIRQRKYMIALKFSFGELPLWIILVFCSIGYSLAEKTTPENQAAVRGAEVHLNCSLLPFEQKANWQFMNTTDTESKFVYLGKGVSKNYKDYILINESVSGSAPLTIIKLSEITSGRYLCTLSSTLYTAQVIMLDAPPTCSKEMTASSVKATCRIGFTGFWRPDLEWSNAEGKILADGSSNVQNNSTVTSSVTIPLSSTDPYHLTCTQKFTKARKPPDEIATAENIPELTYSCSVSNEPKPTDEPNPKDKSTVDPKQPKPSKPPKPTTTPIQTGAPAVDGGPSSSNNPPSSAVSAYDGHNQYLHLCLVTLIFIGMLHKWLWAMTEEDKV